MFLMHWISLALILLSLFLIFLSFLISKKNVNDREKNSQFECGFNPGSLKRLPFSMRFFMITVIFLIFDVEIALLLPLINSTAYSDKTFWFQMMIYFILILIIGTLIEWKKKYLNWN